MRRVLVALSILAMVLGACGGGAATPSAGGQVTVKIGLSAGFSGDNAFYGQASERGINIAIDELKKTDPSIVFTLVPVDDECTPDGGGRAFGKLLDVDKVDIILGSTCSGATLAGMPLLPKAKVAAMSFAASNDAISQQSGVGGNEYMWRMNLDEGMIAEFGVKYMADQKQTNVVFLGENNDYGRGAAETYAPLLAKYGIKVLSTDFFDPGTNDMRPLITKYIGLKPDAVVMLAEAPECALFARQQKELGVHFNISGRGGCTTPTGLAAVGDVSLVEGAVDFDYWAVTDKQPFLQLWAAKYSEAVDYNAPLAYYATYTLYYAVKAGGPGAAGIEKGLGLVDYQSPIGQIKFDDHHQAHPDVFIITVKNGKAVVLTELPTQ